MKRGIVRYPKKNENSTAKLQRGLFSGFLVSEVRVVLWTITWIGIVRFLLLSDIHSNLDALEACLAAAPEYDVVANLGDIVGYGACPNEVITRSRELGPLFVR